MKKFILTIIIFLMFIPFCVNAETCDTDKITISSITVDSKSDNVEELDEATSNGKNITLNLSMSEVGDSIEYKFVVKNDSNEDYELDKTSLNLNSDYINYSFETDDRSNVVKANSSKNVILRVEYKTEVPEDKFESGLYNDNKTMIVQLSNGNTINVPDTFKNPNTGVQSYILVFLIVLLVSGTIYVVLKKKKYTKFMILIIGTVIIIPISVYALCKCEIIVNSNIKINKVTECGSFSEDTWETISINVKNNNTFCYHVGDIKSIDLNEYGTQIIRISNMSEPDECKNDNFSQTACGFVIEFQDIIDKKIFNSKSYDGSTGGNVGGWKESDMRKYLNNEFFELLPIDLKDVMIETYVVSSHGLIENQNIETYDRMYLLSKKEVGFTLRYDSAMDSTRLLDYYNIYNNRMDRIKKINNTAESWWLRSATSDTWSYYFVVSNDGFESSGSNNTSQGLSPAFRVG